MAKVVSILSPLPGVDFKVGSISMRSSDPARRVWDVEVSVNLGKWSDDAGEIFRLGQYRTGLAASLAFEAGNRKHLVWDCLMIALTGDEQIALAQFLNRQWPGSVEAIVNACILAEEELYCEKSLPAHVDRAGAFDDRNNYGKSLWVW